MGLFSFLGLSGGGGLPGMPNLPNLPDINMPSIPSAKGLASKFTMPLIIGGAVVLVIILAK